MQPLPPEVKAELDRGNKLNAIRLLRQSSGLGLREAKEAVERGEVAGPNIPNAALLDDLPLPVIDATLRGRKVEAVKRLRELSGVGLKDAKEAVDRYQSRNMVSKLSPIEEPGLGSWLQEHSAAVGLSLLVLLAAAAAWRYL